MCGLTTGYDFRKRFVERKRTDPFPVYQCHICACFTHDQSLFIAHLQGSEHRERTEERSVVCQSGDCGFRSRDLSKLLRHLDEKRFHFVNASIPACLLTFTTLVSLTQPPEIPPSETTARDVKASRG
ncbi:hypothetical protein RvY_18085 [Ramazzottius varieornatus]|uniref:C2H2-type domain-containing protein n=1 Tax=Ramazzottius varieornatus TaxID=947166 RepID=A0A1D1W9V6_RAMVA|nr:hypothetical protein RvY_18085 [Ramazzottius varieornatus]